MHWEGTSENVSHRTLLVPSFYAGWYHEATFDPVLEDSKDPEERALLLKKAEWQRWTPVVNMYRFCRDLFNNDNILLLGMYSKTYKLVNGAFTAATFVACCAGMSLGIARLLK